MNCPDCKSELRGDGSCCDYCGWAMVGGGDDPRLPSKRSREQIERDTNTRTMRRARMALEHASGYVREAIAAVSVLPDTKANQKLHENLSATEQQICHLQSGIY